MKKFFLIFCTLIFSAAVFAKDAVFSGEDYCISLSYNETAFPGDAVFVRLNFLPGTKKSKSSRTDFSNFQARMEFLIDGKTVRQSDFYQISKSSKNSRTLLAGVPLSSWWTQDSKCAIKIVYAEKDSAQKEFSLPFALNQKEFVSETLELNQGNTEIKTNTSVKRMDQIKKLNEILSTVNSADVYQTKSFTPPTPATRRTSFFADRRIYKYTNGKSSTSLHYGIDYGIQEGSNVASCGDGKVVMAENRISTGWSVVVEHLPGLYSLYYHMKELKVKEGDMVKAGQTVGLSGQTGLATGPHLHWEVRLNSEAVSPDFFTGDFTFSEE